MTMKRKLCGYGSCLPCDLLRIERGDDTVETAGELFARTGKLRVRRCRIHGEQIPDGDPREAKIKIAHADVVRRDPAPSKAGLPRPRWRAKRETLAARAVVNEPALGSGDFLPRDEVDEERRALQRLVRACLDQDGGA